MSHFSYLQGLAVSEVKALDGYVQLVFGDRTVLNIFNAYKTSGCTSVNDLAGRSLQTARETDEFIALVFDQGFAITVDLRDEAYCGPEALELHRPDRPIRVW